MHYVYFMQNEFEDFAAEGGKADVRWVTTYMLMAYIP